MNPSAAEGIQREWFRPLPFFVDSVENAPGAVGFANGSLSHGLLG